MFSYNLGDNVRCSHSFIYLFLIKLSSPSLFIPKSTPFFLNPASWLSSTFNTPHSNYFTTNNLINTLPSPTTSTLFYHSKFKIFAQNPAVVAAISNSIFDPLHLVPEPSYLACSDIFDGWFGIPFKDTICFTHVCSHYPSEILTLYGVSYLVPIYPCIISVAQIQTLILHVLPLRVSNHIHKYFPF